MLNFGMVTYQPSFFDEADRMEDTLEAMKTISWRGAGWKEVACMVG